MSNEVKWLGHATFEINTSKGKTIIVDPWYDGNPSNDKKAVEVDKADIVLITHDHFDHLGEAAAILKQTKATMVGQPEIMEKLKGEGVSEEQVVYGTGMNVGGSVEVEDIKITMTQAVHSATSGDPAGYIITLEDGKTIYYAGDTGIMNTMEIFGELYEIDLAILPIGSVFTMDSVQAAHALKLLKPKAALPMHYSTFPILEQTADKFKSLASEKAPGVDVVSVEPGSACEL